MTVRLRENPNWVRREVFVCTLRPIQTAGGPQGTGEGPGWLFGREPVHSGHGTRLAVVTNSNLPGCRAAGLSDCQNGVHAWTL